MTKAQWILPFSFQLLLMVTFFRHCFWSCRHRRTNLLSFWMIRRRRNRHLSSRCYGLSCRKNMNLNFCLWSSCLSSSSSRMNNHCWMRTCKKIPKTCSFQKNSCWNYLMSSLLMSLRLNFYCLPVLSTSLMTKMMNGCCRGMTLRKRIRSRFQMRINRWI